MIDRELNLGKSPETPRFFSLAERLVLAYQGRRHFEEAINQALAVECPDKSLVFLELNSIGMAMIKAGVSPEMAIEAMQTAKENLPSTYWNYQDLQRHVDSQIKNYRDYLKTGRPGKELSQILEKPVRKIMQLPEMCLGEALKACSQVDKAILEAQNGINNKQTVSEAAKLVAEIQNISKQAKGYIRIWLAQSLGQDLEGAKGTLEVIKALIETMRPEEKQDAGLFLAAMMEKAGYDATELFNQCFLWIKEFGDEDPGWDRWQELRWAFYEDGIRILAECGHFDLASEYLATMTETADYYSRSGLLTKIASEKIKRGLKKSEIENLDDFKIQAILTGDNKAAKEALRYFGLI